MMRRFRRLGIVRSIENLPSLADNSHLLTMNISLSEKRKPPQDEKELNSPTREVPPHHLLLVDEEVGAVLFRLSHLARKPLIV